MAIETRTFEVLFHGGGTMIVRAPTPKKAEAYTRSAAKALGVPTARIIKIRPVKVLGFGSFGEATE